MFCRSMQCSLFSWKTGHQTRNLISQENDVSTLIGKEALPMETKRYRDIVRKASINGDYMIIGVGKKRYAVGNEIAERIQV